METLALLQKHRNTKYLCNHPSLVTPIIGYTISLVCVKHSDLTQVVGGTAFLLEAHISIALSVPRAQLFKTNDVVR